MKLQCGEALEKIKKLLAMRLPKGLPKGLVHKGLPKGCQKGQRGLPWPWLKVAGEAT